MQGDFEQARSRATAASDRFTELGWTIRARTDIAPVVAEIEQLAGEFPQAMSTLRANCEELLSSSSRAHDRRHLSTQSAQLAHLLCDAGDLDQAEQWLTVADRYASRVDASAQIWRRLAAAEIAAARGDVGRAEVLARRALRRSARTDAVSERSAAELTLAKVLAGRAEAASLIRDAVRRYDKKENRVAATRARSLLNELPVA
jgi:tetratricopeptide (TPR) repeat protein